MIKQIIHLVTTESESMQGVVNTINAYDLLLDIKALVSEYYIATFSQEKDSLKISFNNGQRFKIEIKEME